MQVGTTKDQGLYNKPSTAVHPRTLGAGTVPQYNTTWNTCSYTHYVNVLQSRNKYAINCFSAANFKQIHIEERLVSSLYAVKAYLSALSRNQTLKRIMVGI